MTLKCHLATKIYHPLSSLLQDSSIVLFCPSFVPLLLTHWPPSSIYHHIRCFTNHQPVVWKKEQHVYSEIYNSNAFIEENDRVQHATLPPDDPDCKWEKVVIAMMFWSDSTHLANFGMAKLWPIYMMIGNLSKYICALPSSGACMHVAYIPHLADSFEDFASTFHCKLGTQKCDTLTHC